MIWIFSVLAGVYLLVGLVVGFMVQSANPAGEIHWGEVIGVALVVWLGLALVTVILAAIVGGLMVLF